MMNTSINIDSLKTEKIAVLYGGNSAEREVSLQSGMAVFAGLTQAGLDVQVIDTKDLNLSDLNSRGIDRVFIALHGRGGEDGCIQGALEYLGIPYTGSGVLGSALSMDKVRTKQIFEATGLPTANFAVVNRDEFNPSLSEDILNHLGGKVMVKPAKEGSSIGMAIATTSTELNKALTDAFAYDQQILVEAWLSGDEFTVAILGEQALPAISMVTPHEFYDYQAKYQSNSTQYLCPCGLEPEAEERLKAMALKAFKATGAQGWGRVDAMQDSQGNFNLLEVNTVPGMTPSSLVPKAANVAGYSFEQLVTKILQLSDINRG